MSRDRICKLRAKEMSRLARPVDVPRHSPAIINFRRLVRLDGALRRGALNPRRVEREIFRVVPASCRVAARFPDTFGGGDSHSPRRIRANLSPFSKENGAKKMSLSFTARMFHRKLAGRRRRRRRRLIHQTPNSSFRSSVNSYILSI